MDLAEAIMNPKIDFPLLTDLPRPIDDGAADHLKGMRLPNVPLPSTRGRTVHLEKLGGGRTVIYCYPMTGVLEAVARRVGLGARSARMHAPGMQFP